MLSLPITGGGLLCRPRGWVHADHPILQVLPGSGVTIMKASPGTRFSGRVMMTE